MMAHVSDIELIRKCINDNDIDAWEVFVRKFSNLVWNSIRKTFYNYSFQHTREDIEDMYSSVFLSLMENDFKKLRQFRSRNDCAVSTWLAIITVRATIDMLRKDKSHLSVDTAREDQDLWDIIPDRKPRADRRIENVQEERKFERTIENLPPRDRMIYDMLYNKGFSAEKTAEMLGMTVSSIYTRKHRIIEKIKKSVSEM
jgi:RNA polymerase sigma-70 factor (ECF subfamily)